MHPLFQPLPPLAGAGGFDIVRLLLNMLFAVLWSIVASVGFAAAIAIGLWVFNKLTPGIDEMAELRNGNRAVGVLWAAFVLAVAIVIVAVLLK